MVNGTHPSARPALSALSVCTNIPNSFVVPVVVFVLNTHVAILLSFMSFFIFILLLVFNMYVRQSVRVTSNSMYNKDDSDSDFDLFSNVKKFLTITVPSSGNTTVTRHNVEDILELDGSVIIRGGLQHRQLWVCVSRDKGQSHRLSSPFYIKSTLIGQSQRPPPT